ncbi:hypothetical protein ACH5RR_022928 [Cinchona calisaya]|uniref:GDSL esterase/lipase n=1 Tax=Cinchona calisaya TaxID=153742 RepID=A0ABD2ZB23_9GENT
MRFFFSALASGLPYLDPSEKEDGNFATGVNFAVAGSTALSNEALKAMIITNTSTNSSLGVQVEWMTSHFKSVCQTKEGFDVNSLQKACCGVGEPYNFNAGKICGTPEAKVCPNPDKYLSWDGIHSTQQAYKYMAGYLLHSIIPQLHCHGA